MPACRSRDGEEFCRSRLRIFSKDRGSCNRVLPAQYRSGAVASDDSRGGMQNGALEFSAALSGYFVSRCNVCRPKKGLYFFFSSRFGVRGLFLFRVVMKRDTGFPKDLASVHSKMTISCGIGVSPSLPSALLPLPPHRRLLPPSNRTKR